MKIEQQERSTKHICEEQSMCERTQFKENTTQTKVKEAKSKTRKQDWTTERSVFSYNDFESLILAQDERWRRA